MATVEFKLADIGEGIAEVEVMEWRVEKGSAIEEFDAVCEVQSDKATVEITSRYRGKVLELCHEVGDMAKVGEPLILIDVDEADGGGAGAAGEGEAAAPAQEAAAAAPPAAAPATPSGKVLTTPAVRRIARERKVDLALVTPTGPKGRLLKEDVLRFLDGGGAAATPASAAAAAATPAPAASSAPAAAAAAAAPAYVPQVYAAEDVTHKVSGLQRVMVRTMEEASRVPTLLYCDEIVLNELAEVRRTLKPLAEQRGVRLSYMPFLIKATSMALRRFPRMNAHYAGGDEYTVKGAHNIGVAMQTPRGLLVPSIKNVQDMSVLDVAAELTRLMTVGKDGKLGAADLQGGTLTLSNVGAIGGTYTYPLLPVPQVAIAGLGSIQTVPRYDSAMQVYPAQVMNVSWAADHRVLEGAVVAEFSNAVKAFVEQPATMLLDSR